MVIGEIAKAANDDGSEAMAPLGWSKAMPF